MNSLERRDSLLRLLRRRGDWTIADLAHELDVSRRTILRDVNHLRERGFDISGMSGPGGGVHLEATSVMITSHLDTDEVVALILSVAIARATTWIPFADGAERALAKIEAALPKQRVGELQRFMQRVLIGDATLDMDSAVPGIDPTLVATFERAFTSSRLLTFSYVDREGRRTRRRVEPHGLLIRAPLWYVIAWDPRRDAPRLFRADRMRRPSITDQTFLPRPHELVTRVCPDARVAIAGPSQRVSGRGSERPNRLRRSK
jgi:predicted DNA-binding transcriptional regulator YafY